MKESIIIGLLIAVIYTNVSNKAAIESIKKGSTVTITSLCTKP